MKIYIEASSFYGQRTGVGRYGLSVTQALMAARPKDEFVLFSFLRPGRSINVDFKIPDNARLQFIRWFPGRLFSLFMRWGIPLPLELFGLSKADLMIFPNFIAWPSIFGKNRIATIHDLAFLEMPNFVQAKNLRYLTKQLPKTLRRSRALIAVSESTKQDIQKQGVDQQKITVVPNAVDHTVFNRQAFKKNPGVCKKLGLPSKYILFTGTLEPRKNIEGLLDAFAKSYSEHNLPIVLVGGKGWNDDNISKKLENLHDLPIYKTDFVDDQSLAAIYTAATVFVYPSFYEGFGIPVLEAMACGCPVICSDNSAFPEVVGDAAIMVDAYNSTAIAAAMTEVISSAPVRKRMITKGLQRAQNFTWSRSAQQLSQLIDTVSYNVNK